MHLDRLHRVSGYLTLALASLCLCYAEADFLPAWPLLLAAALAALAAAFVAERRGWALSVRAANVLGVLIALTVAGSVALYFWLSGPAEPLIEGLPVPVTMLPFAGPLVI